MELTLTQETIESLRRGHRAQTALRIAVLLGAVIVVHVSLERFTSPPARVAAEALLGYFMVGCYVLAHELVHRRFFPKRWMDDLLGYLLLTPELVDFRDYRGGHMEHHRWTTGRDDPGFIEIPPGRRVARALTFIAHYLNMSYLLSHPWTICFPPRSVGRREAIFGVLKSIGPAVAVLPMLGLTRWWWHVGAPYLSFCFFNTVKNAAEHDYLYEGETGPERQEIVTRSLRSTPWTRFFWANCMYHVEHHLFPSVPFHNLPALQGELKRSRPACSYLGFVWLRLRRGVEYPFFI